MSEVTGSEVADRAVLRPVDSNDDHGVWGSDLMALVTLSGECPDWPLAERIWATLNDLWSVVRALDLGHRNGGKGLVREMTRGGHCARYIPREGPRPVQKRIIIRSRTAGDINHDGHLYREPTPLLRRPFST